MVAASGTGREAAAIPHTLSAHLCIDFVNSRFTDHTGTGQVHDRLRLAEWQQWYAHRCGVADSGPPSRSSLRTLTELRDTLRSLLVTRRRPDDQSLERLNAIIAGAAQFWQLQRTQRAVQAQLGWRPGDWRAIAAATVVSYAQLAAGGQSSRVKVCANPDCTWVFYDESRNRSRRWCESGACGNLVKVRRHRSHRRPVRVAGGQPPHRRRSEATSRA